MKKRYLEILRDIEDIQKKIEDRSVTADDEKKLDELIAEKRNLEEKFKSLEDKAANARKLNVDLDNNLKPEADERLAKLDLRSKLSYAVGKRARNKNFTDAEKRALGAALTTTAATYVEASELVDGVNNAGIFISTKLILDLLREESKLSPILADINFTAVPGLLEYPFRKTRDKAQQNQKGL